MPTQTTISSKTFNTIEEQNKILYDRTRFNQYLATKSSPIQYTRIKIRTCGIWLHQQKQTIDGLIAANPKEGEKAQINITNNEN